MWHNGIIDLNLLDSKLNCLLASVSYAILSSENEHPLQALKSFQTQFKQPQDLINKYFTKIQQVRSFKIISLSKACVYLSKISSKNICIIHIVKHKFLVKFITKEVTAEPVLFILLAAKTITPHVIFNYLLRNRKYFFCKKCLKSYRIKLVKKHFCQQGFCVKCHRALDLCKDDTTVSECSKCNFLFVNRACFSMHKHINCSQQKIPRRFLVCEKCYKSHQKSEYCPIEYIHKQFPAMTSYILTTVSGCADEINKVFVLINIGTLDCYISTSFCKSFHGFPNICKTDDFTSLKDKVVSGSYDHLESSSDQSDLLINLLGHQFLKFNKIFVEDSVMSILSTQIKPTELNKIFYLKNGLSFLYLGTFKVNVLLESSFSIFSSGTSCSDTSCK